MAKEERSPVLKTGDRFETIYRALNQQGVVLKRFKGYYPYSANMSDFYEVRFDDGHEETLHRMQYTCKKVK